MTHFLAHQRFGNAQPYGKHSNRKDNTDIFNTVCRVIYTPKEVYQACIDKNQLTSGSKSAYW